MAIIRRWLSLSAILVFTSFTQIQAQGSPKDSVRIISLLLQSDSFLKNDPAQAIVKLQTAGLLLNRQAGAHPVLTARLFMGYSNWFAESGNYDSALFYARSAYDLAAVSGSPATCAKTSITLASSLRYLGYPDSALHYYFLAERWSKEAHDPVILSRCYYNLGNVFSDLGKFDEAGKYYQLSRDLSEKINDQRFTAFADHALASNLSDRGHYEASLPHMLKALAYFQHTSDREQVAVIYNNLGNAYEALNRYTEALTYFDLSLKLNTELGHFPEIAREHNNQATVLMHLGKYQQAISALKEAQLIALRVNDRDILAEVYNNLSFAHAHLGKYQQAYEFRQQFEAINDSLLNEEMLKHTARLQEEYESEKRLLEIRNLKQENEVQDLKNKMHVKQRDTLIWLACGMFCISLLIFFIYRQKAQNAKQVAEKNEEIYRQKLDEVMRTSELQSIHSMVEAQEKERKRIAEDLHDRVGSMLSTIKLTFSFFEQKLDNKSTSQNEQLGKISRMLDEACEEIRSVSHNLVSGVLATFGLIPALQDMKDALEQSSDLSIDLHTFGMDVRVPNHVEITLYRIVQELFNNTIRHSGATRVDLEVSRFDNQINMVYSDNGRGFDEHAMFPGMGLKNIHSRVDKLGGQLHIDSGKGSGATFIIHLTLP